MRNTANRSVKMAVCCLLTKLTFCLNNEVLAALISFRDKRMVGHILESVRESLPKDFVPNYIGFEHISREKIIKDHTRPMAKYPLIGGTDAAVFKLDGTYIYILPKGCM